MSAHPLWIITCNVDGEPIDFDCHEETLRAARVSARQMGWKTGKGLRGPDYCPKHIPGAPDSGEGDRG